ncbi:Hemolysin-type calcium-binding repeat-containing protein, partial [Ruegeria marina]
GNDFLFAVNGNDDLQGGAGNDSLYGGANDDTLSGGADDDILYGGQGSDTFEFGINDGQDVIRDFEDGIDVIDLLGGLTFASLTFSPILGGVRAEVTSAPGSWIDFDGLAIGALDATDFV